MTISYVDDISNGQGIFIFAKILARWKGSLYKLVWTDLLIYIGLYYVMNLSYRFLLSEQQQRVFESIVLFCERTKRDIPISFLLGFFVAGIIGRWYRMFLCIPWMNELAMHVSACINGRDEEGARRVRLTLMRYLNLSWVLLMRLISDQISDRFIGYQEEEAEERRRRRRPRTKTKLNRDANQPWSIDAAIVQRPASVQRPHSISVANKNTVQTSELLAPPGESPATPNSIEEDGSDIRDAFEARDDGCFGDLLRSFNKDKQIRHTFGKLITEGEIKTFQRIAISSFRRTRKTYTPEYWVPIQWAQRLVLKALISGYIVDPKVAYITVGKIGSLRQKMQDLQIFSSIMIPLVYTQVVIIAVYSYFLCQIFASQFVRQENPNDLDKLDLYVPVFNIFTFLFLMGWLKVALCVMNPFGDDDEDFQTSDILDYNLEVSYRSTVLEKTSFPENMSVPLMTPPRPPPEVDDLDEFLEGTHVELNASIRATQPDEVANLEMRPSRFGRFKSCCQCGNSQYQAPNTTMQQTSTSKWNWF